MGALVRPGGVADHAVVDLDTAAVEPIGRRPRPDAHDDQIGAELGAVGQLHGLDVTVAPDLGNSDAGAHVDPFGAMQPGHQFADLFAKDGRQRRGLRFDQYARRLPIRAD